MFFLEPKSYWQWRIAFCIWFIHLFIFIWMLFTDLVLFKSRLTRVAFVKTLFLICINLNSRKHWSCGIVDLSKAFLFLVDLSIIQMNDGNEKHFNVFFFILYSFAFNASIAFPSINGYFRFDFLSEFILFTEMSFT